MKIVPTIVKHPVYCCAPDCSWEESADAIDQYYRSVIKGNSDGQLFRSRREEERRGCQATEVWRFAACEWDSDARQISKRDILVKLLRVWLKLFSLNSSCLFSRECACRFRLNDDSSPRTFLLFSVIVLSPF